MEDINPVGSDEPLHDVIGDRYHLAHVAYHLARVIDNVKGTGQVVAVNAPWGGGKTSVVNLMRSLFLPDERTGGMTRDRERYRPARCPIKTFDSDLRDWGNSSTTFVDFNAWLESGNEAIAFSIIDNIADTLADASEARKFGKRILRHVRRNPGQLVKGAIGLFNVANLAFGTSQLTDTTFDVNSLATKLEKDVATLVKKMEDEQRRIVIVIDDIDRMPPDRIHSLIVALWWIRQLPRVSFLLLYDRNQVIDSLARTMFKSSNEADGKDAAARFMEKIVQYSFDVPQPTRDQLLGILDEDLKQSEWLAPEVEEPGPLVGERIPGHAGERFGGDQRWTAIKKYILRELVNTPRAVKRLVLATEVSWSMRKYIPIDLRDLVAVEAVRLFRPELFADIEALASRIERGDDVAVGEWSASAGAAKTIQAILMPAHFRDTGQNPLETSQAVEARRGFGVPRLMSHYLQAVPHSTVSVQYNLEEFFHFRDAEFQATLFKAAMEGNLPRLVSEISGLISEGQSNDRTHAELANELRAAARSLDRRGAPDRRLAEEFETQAEIVDE